MNEPDRSHVQPSSQLSSTVESIKLRCWFWGTIRLFKQTQRSIVASDSAVETHSQCHAWNNFKALKAGLALNYTARRISRLIFVPTESLQQKVQRGGVFVVFTKWRMKRKSMKRRRSQYSQNLFVQPFMWRSFLIALGWPPFSRCCRTCTPC